MCGHIFAWGHHFLVAEVSTRERTEVYVCVCICVYLNVCVYTCVCMCMPQWMNLMSIWDYEVSEAYLHIYVHWGEGTDHVELSTNLILGFDQQQTNIDIANLKGCFPSHEKMPLLSLPLLWCVWIKWYIDPLLLLSVLQTFPWPSTSPPPSSWLQTGTIPDYGQWRSWSARFYSAFSTWHWTCVVKNWKPQNSTNCSATMTMLVMMRWWCK